MFFKDVAKNVFAFGLMVLTALSCAAQVPSSQHVVLVIDENSSFSSVMNGMPWLVAEGRANGYATNYQSNNGGSLLDYLWLASGSCHSSANCNLPAGTHDFRCSGNACYYPGTAQSDPITDDNIFRELNKAKVSWKVYAQSYSAAGGEITSPDNSNGTSYYRRHNGATWYSDVLSNVEGSAAKIVDFSQLAADLGNGALPRFVIIVPDGRHDAHDCPGGQAKCYQAQKLAAADQFLKSTLIPILNTASFRAGGDGLLIVTFDECAGGTNYGCGGSVYTALIGPQVIPHTISNVPYRHENTLRTLLESLDITTYPGAAATAVDMSDFFVAAGASPNVTVSSPSSGQSVSSPVTIQASAVPTTGASITGWFIYVDGTAVYQSGAADAISPSVKLAAGTHTLLVRAWDSSGAFGDRSLTVSAGTARPGVNVSTPVNGGATGSPVNVQASASASSGHEISGWWIYVDGVGTYTAGEGGSINANVEMSSGDHTLIVRAWDTSGAYGDQAVAVTVSNAPVEVSDRR